SGARRNFQVDVAENGMCIVTIGFDGGSRAVPGDSGGICEIQVAKFDSAGNGGVRRDLHEAVVDLGLRAQDVIQAAHGGGATLENVGDPAKRDHRPDEQIQIKEECEERADGKLVAQDLMAALPEKDEKGSTDERLKRRHEHAPSADELDVAGDVFTIGRVEPSYFRAFLSVGADYADSGEVLLDLGGECGQRSLNGFVELVNDFAEVAHGDCD